MCLLLSHAHLVPRKTIPSSSPSYPPLGESPLVTTFGFPCMHPANRSSLAVLVSWHLHERRQLAQQAQPASLAPVSYAGHVFFFWADKNESHHLHTHTLFFFFCSQFLYFILFFSSHKRLWAKLCTGHTGVRLWRRSGFLTSHLSLSVLFSGCPLLKNCSCPPRRCLLTYQPLVASSLNLCCSLTLSLVHKLLPRFKVLFLNSFF